jgi:hypothetical protein
MRDGADGGDLIIKVPVGTIIRKKEAEVRQTTSINGGSSSSSSSRPLLQSRRSSSLWKSGGCRFSNVCLLQQQLLLSAATSRNDRGAATSTTSCAHRAAGHQSSRACRMRALTYRHQYPGQHIWLHTVPGSVPQAYIVAVSCTTLGTFEHTPPCVLPTMSYRRASHPLQSW